MQPAALTGKPRSSTRRRSGAAVPPRQLGRRCGAACFLGSSSCFLSSSAACCSSARALAMALLVPLRPLAPLWGLWSSSSATLRAAAARVGESTAPPPLPLKLLLRDLMLMIASSTPPRMLPGRGRPNWRGQVARSPANAAGGMRLSRALRALMTARRCLEPGLGQLGVTGGGQGWWVSRAWPHALLPLAQTQSSSAAALLMQVGHLHRGHEQRLGPSAAPCSGPRSQAPCVACRRPASQCCESWTATVDCLRAPELLTPAQLNTMSYETGWAGPTGLAAVRPSRCLGTLAHTARRCSARRRQRQMAAREMLRRACCVL